VGGLSLSWNESLGNDRGTWKILCIVVRLGRENYR